MLQVILFILKMIGWILLSIISLFLLILLCVMFVPVRYRGILHYHDDLNAKVCISWLLHIIHLTVSLENGELIQTLRIFGIKFHKKAPKEPTSPKNTENEKDLLDIPETVISEETIDTDERSSINQIKETVDADERSSVNQIKETAPEKQKESLIDKWKRFIKMLYDKIRNIQYTFETICDKIKNIMKKMDSYIEFIQDEQNQSVFRLLMGELGSLFKHIKPRRFRMELEIGSEDPSVTGAILAVLGIIYPIFEGGLHVNPHFDEAVFETDIDFRGHMTAFVFLKTAWKVYFDKDVKRLLKTLKNMEEQ